MKAKKVCELKSFQGLNPCILWLLFNFISFEQKIEAEMKKISLQDNLINGICLSVSSLGFSYLYPAVLPKSYQVSQ